MRRRPAAAREARDPTPGILMARFFAVVRLRCESERPRSILARTLILLTWRAKQIRSIDPEFLG